MTGWLLLVLLSALLSVAAFTCAVRARLGSTAQTVAAMTIVATTLISLPIYGLGLIHQLTRNRLSICVVVLSMLVLLASWKRRDRTFSRALLEGAREVVCLPFAGLREAWVARSPVLVPLIACAFLLTWNAAAAWLGPSWRSWDALWYHEPIIGHTIQNRGFQVVDLPFDGLQKINGYPRLLEMLSLWFAIFTGRQLIDLPNVMLMPGLICAVYAACRQRSTDRLACMGWAASMGIIPAYVESLQTTLVDSALMTFVVCGFTFAIKRPLRARDALLAAFALALACNTKIPGVFPALALSLIVAARLVLESTRAQLARAVGTIALGVCIIAGFSAATYLRNFILFDNPVWPDLKVDIDSLGIHWPGLLPWGKGPTSATPTDQVNMAVPWTVLVSELFAAPFSVADREHRYIYKYGIGVIWVAMPLMVAASAVLVTRAAVGLLRGRLPARQHLLGPELTALLVCVTMVVSSVALWAPRYNLAAVAIGSVLVCWTFAGAVYRSLMHAVILTVAIGGIMVVCWDYASWRIPTPAQLAAFARVPYPAREMMPALGAPVDFRVATLREAELSAGKTVVTNDFPFSALLWNNDYSNRVVPVRNVDLATAAEREHATWIYVTEPHQAAQIAARGDWELVGSLNVDGWGTALRRKSK